MLDYCLWQWCKEQPIIVRASINPGASFGIIYDSDPMRFAVTISGGLNGSLSYGFGDSPPANSTFTVSSTSDRLSLTYEEVGGLVRERIWARTPTSATTIDWIALSMRPERYAVLQRYINEYLSRSGAL